MGRLSRLSSLACVMLLLPGVAPTQARQAAVWKDPSPHRARFVTVTPTVRLEILDWGGSGRPLVLLAGGGDTAHVFDDFATTLTRGFHVYGITRRGFGASGFNASESGADRLGDDVVAVLDALELRSPVLVGHSLGGLELSSVASRYPRRVAGLVYLDAAYPYAFGNGSGPSFDDFQNLNGPQPPPPGQSDRANFAALKEYFQRVLGFTFPEAELRQQWTVDRVGRIASQRDFPGYKTLLSGLKQYTGIQAPALIVFGIPHGLGTSIEASTNPNVREAAAKYTAALTAVSERQIKVVEDVMPTARIVRLAGAHHYIFLSNEADVLREMRAFLDGLR